MQMLLNYIAMCVALCEEGVDRNILFNDEDGAVRIVALCEEGVDRNAIGATLKVDYNVALCEEGVDRNDDRTEQQVGRPGCRPLRRGRG